MRTVRGAYRILLAIGVTAAAMWSLVAIVAAPVRAQNGDARYYALVIGNNAYEHLPDLETAVSDAAAAAELLRSKYGFEIKLMLNATRTELLAEMNRLQGALGDNDRLLIYYAGHGVLDRITQTGYWLPTDAMEEDDTNWVANSQISRYLQRMSARHVMVVADSCYSGTLLREVRATPAVAEDRQALLERLADKRARTAMVSGGLEPVVDGGRNGHSVFASAFLKALRENNDILDGQGLFREVQRDVVLNADQTPEYADLRKAGHEGGDFLFIPANRRLAATRPGPRPVIPAIDKEALFWQSIQASDDPADYRDYLKRYPKGDFASLARRRLTGLDTSTKPATQAPAARAVTPPSPAPAPAPVVSPRPAAAPAISPAPVPAAPTTPPPVPAVKPAVADPETTLWDAVKDSQDGAAFEVYLSRYPNGRYSVEAGERRTALQKAEAAPAVPNQTAAVVPVKPVAPPQPSNAWRLKISANSFSYGDLGGVEADIKLSDGRYKSRLSSGQFNVWVTFKLDGDRIDGQITVSPGLEWFDLSLNFSGDVDDGVFNKTLSGIATVQRAGGGRDSQDLDVRLRLERLP